MVLLMQSANFFLFCVDHSHNHSPRRNLNQTLAIAGMAFVNQGSKHGAEQTVEDARAILIAMAGRFAIQQQEHVWERAVSQEQTVVLEIHV